MGRRLSGINRPTTSKFYRLTRDDVRAGAYLNKRIKGSPVDYTREECYYWSRDNNVDMAFSFFERRIMPHGCLAEFAIAAENDFIFSKRVFKDTLALFFENKYYNNNIRLQALISPKNEQAIRLAGLAGMTVEGRLREVAKDGDRLLYSMLKKEFEEIYGRYIFSTQSTHAARPGSNSRSGSKS